MNSQETTEMKCGCIIEFINGKHMVTQYCPEHEDNDVLEMEDDPKYHKIRKFQDSESI